MPTRLPSFCKINLGLAVGPPRPDGYHGLMTVYQTIGLHDFVTVAAHPAARTHITLEADHPSVPCTATGDCDRNTAYRIVAGALERLGMSAAVEIRIEKRLPVQGGLGAGSANAAAALIGLERELGRALSGPDRLALAAEIGSDVPLFLVGGTVLGLSRGEAVYPLPESDKALPVVVAIPDVGVSTAQAFRDLDARATAEPPSLTPLAPSGKLEQLSRVLASVWTPSGLQVEAGRVTTGIAGSSFRQPAGSEEPLSSGAGVSLRDANGDQVEKTGVSADFTAGSLHPLLTLVRTGVENDFESVAFRQHPSLRDIQRALEGTSSGASGAIYAALSGSGSALFGMYAIPEAAHEAQQRVQSLGTRALLTETLPRSEYWRRMFA